MAGATSSIEGVLMDFLAPILPKIGGELTREVLINLHRLVSGNDASNLGGCRHGHLALRMTANEYKTQT